MWACLLGTSRTPASSCDRALLSLGCPGDTGTRHGHGLAVLELRRHQAQVHVMRGGRAPRRGAQSGRLSPASLRLAGGGSRLLKETDRDSSALRGCGSPPPAGSGAWSCREASGPGSPPRRGARRQRPTALCWALLGPSGRVCMAGGAGGQQQLQGFLSSRLPPSSPAGAEPQIQAALLAGRGHELGEPGAAGLCRGAGLSAPEAGGAAGPILSVVGPLGEGVLGALRGLGATWAPTFLPLTWRRMPAHLRGWVRGHWVWGPSSSGRAWLLSQPSGGPQSVGVPSGPPRALPGWAWRGTVTRPSLLKLSRGGHALLALSSPRPRQAPGGVTTGSAGTPGAAGGPGHPGGGQGVCSQGTAHAPPS